MKRCAIVILLAFGLGAAAPVRTTPTAAQGECGSETDATRRIALRFASDDALAGARQRAHVRRTPAGEVHLMTDEQAAGLCRRLKQSVATRIGKDVEVHEQELAFYRAGPSYYGVVKLAPRNGPPGVPYIDSRWTPLYVFDREFRVVHVAAM